MIPMLDAPERKVRCVLLTLDCLESGGKVAEMRGDTEHGEARRWGSAREE